MLVQVGADGVGVVEDQLAAHLALVEHLLHHLDAVLRLVLPDLDVMHLDGVGPQMGEGELVIADGAGGDHIVLGLAADLQSTRLKVDVLSTEFDKSSESSESINLNQPQFTWWDFLPGCARHGGRPTYSTQCSARR